MFKRSQSRLIQLAVRLLTVILIIGLLVQPVWAGTEAVDYVRQALRNYYVDILPEQILAAPTIPEILARLNDPHTTYFTRQEALDFIKTMVEHSYVGIGIVMRAVEQGILIESVMPGTPAEGAGLQAGDIITEVDGISIIGYPEEKAGAMIRGPEGTSVVLTVIQGEQEILVTVIRAAIRIPLVSTQVLHGHIGYIDINGFGERTSAELGQAIAALKSELVDAWIIDLRDNGGGYMETACDLAGYFVGPKVAVRTQDRKGNIKNYQATYHGLPISEPVVILINRNSASAAEIFALVLRDHERAIIMGEKSYGKGTVQQLAVLPNGDILKLTTERWYSPAGAGIDKTGIIPDLTLKDSDPLVAAGVLLNSDAAKRSRPGTYTIKIGNKEFFIDPYLCQDQASKQALREILAAVAALSH